MAIDPLNSDNLPKAPLRNDADKPSVPVQSSGTGDYVNNHNCLLTKLNMKKWDVDPVKVYKLLLGKEINIDEHSRLVSNPS
jgi:hypothetical protein